MALWHRYDNVEQRGDIKQDTTALSPFRGNLSTDDGILSAVEISLFTDRRAPPGAVLPGLPTDLRGWWGDQFWGVDFGTPQYQIGSLIWLLDRSKNRQATLSQLKDYCEQAVDWMVDAGIIGVRRAITGRVSRDTGYFQLELKRPDSPDSLWTPRWEKTISGL